MSDFLVENAENGLVIGETVDVNFGYNHQNVVLYTSDELPSSPGTSDELPSSPGTSDELPSSPGTSDELPSSPGTSDELPSSPGISDELELSDIRTFALSPVTSSPGLKGILLDILGPYDNVVTQYKYLQNSNGYYTYVNEITPDYPWIASACLFIVLLFSLFRLAGRTFSWMK